VQAIRRTVAIALGIAVAVFLVRLAAIALPYIGQDPPPQAQVAPELTTSAGAASSPAQADSSPTTRVEAPVSDGLITCLVIDAVSLLPIAGAAIGGAAVVGRAAESGQVLAMTNATGVATCFPKEHRRLRASAKGYAPATALVDPGNQCRFELRPAASFAVKITKGGVLLPDVTVVLSPSPMYGAVSQDALSSAPTSWRDGIWSTKTAGDGMCQVTDYPCGPCFVRFADANRIACVEHQPLLVATTTVALHIQVVEPQCLVVDFAGPVVSSEVAVSSGATGSGSYELELVQQLLKKEYPNCWVHAAFSATGDALEYRGSFQTADHRFENTVLRSAPYSQRYVSRPDAGDRSASSGPIAHQVTIEARSPGLNYVGLRALRVGARTSKPLAWGPQLLLSGDYEVTWAEPLVASAVKHVGSVNRFSVSEPSRVHIEIPFSLARWHLRIHDSEGCAVRNAVVYVTGIQLGDSVVEFMHRPHRPYALSPCGSFKVTIRAQGFHDWSADVDVAEESETWAMLRRL
jgi:hypothetical protein